MRARVVVALGLLLVALTGCRSLEPERVTSNSAYLRSAGHCEPGLHGSYSHNLYHPWYGWHRRGDWHHFSCGGYAAEAELPLEFVNDLWSGTDYAYAPCGVWAHEVGGQLYTACFDRNGANGLSTGDWTWFTTDSSVAIYGAARVADEGQTDAQAALDARDVNIVQHFDRGTGKAEPPWVKAQSWWDNNNCLIGSGKCFQIDTECRTAIRLQDSGVVKRDRSFGEFRCESRVEGEWWEWANGASSRFTFELSPANKRFTNVRATGCKRWEDSNGFDHLECTLTDGKHPPVIG